MTEPSSVTSSAAILGAVLAHLRKDRNMTQEDLGKAVGVGATTWSRIEQGSSQLSTEQLRDAAKALGVSAAFVLGKAEDLEEALQSRGIKVENITPKDWSWVKAGKFLDDLIRHDGVIIGAAAANAVSPLVLPVAGVALAGLIAKYWPKKESKKGDASDQLPTD